MRRVVADGVVPREVMGTRAVTPGELRQLFVEAVALYSFVGLAVVVMIVFDLLSRRR